jgi:hypothetical protein
LQEKIQVIYTLLNKLKMKKLLAIIALTLSALFCMTQAEAQENYRALNIGLGVAGQSGYSRYINHVVPVLNINYEFDVARNFTLAPFISFYTYSDSYNWSNNNYTYRETVIPVGLKGSYYFDELLNANSKWDFYAAASAGFAIVNSRWDAGYGGDRNYFNGGRPVFIDLHAGAQYNFSRTAGVYLDLSSGISTIGLAFHQLR